MDRDGRARRRNERAPSCLRTRTTVSSQCPTPEYASVEVAYSLYKHELRSVVARTRGMVLATTPLVVTALGALVAMGPTTFCAASPLPRVNRSGALSVSVREVLAPGWNASTAGSGLRVTEGWGYMDPNVLHVQRTGAPAGGVTVFGTLFYPCDAAEPSAKWLLYCARIWRSSDGAQSPVLALGGGTSGRVEAYQPPMLFFHNGTLLVANWALTSAGSQVLLSSLSADGDWSGDGGATGWQVRRKPPVSLRHASQVVFTHHLLQVVVVVGYRGEEPRWPAAVVDSGRYSFRTATRWLRAPRSTTSAER